MAVGIVLLAMPFALIWVPWQQNIRGTGRVVALGPLERRQSVEAPIGGRVERWWVQEGSHVKAGDRLLEISDIDPNFVARLNEQRIAMRGKYEASREKTAAYEQQLLNLTATRELSATAAEHRVGMAKEKVRAAEAASVAAAAGLKAADAQLARTKTLLADGLVSRRDFDIAERDYEVARTAIESADAAMKSAVDELKATETELGRIRADFDTRIDAATASLHDARGQMQEAMGSLAKLDVDISRQQSQLVSAPRDGFVLRLQGGQGGEIVKAGDPLLVLVPQTEDRAVELWIDGNDAPLVREGDPLRLQFEGWPAVQFVGWPSVAIGTFGGRVVLVDSADNGKGQFRLLAVADPDQPQWPDARYLRQGVRAKGWVLLNRVALGYEIWRQLNGFPPVIADAEPDPDGGDEKTKK